MTKPVDPLGLPAEVFFERFRGESLTFDDLCILQPRTIDFGVQEVDLSSRITRNILINSPLVSSPMEDISEYELAIAVALQGFPAVIHYNMTIEEQVEQVRKVKRFENGFVKDPITLGPSDTIAKAVEIRNQTGISTLPIADGGRLVGLLTKNDYSGRKHAEMTVAERMVPLEGLGHQIVRDDELPEEDTARLSRANDLLLESHAGVLLIVNGSGAIESLVTRTDIEKNEAFPDSIKDRHKSLVVGAAVTTSLGETRERAAALVSAGVDFLCIDSSHGNSSHEKAALEYLKAEHPDIDVIYGNVATAGGAIRGIEWGADAIRVGKGVGSICSTSQVSLGTRSQITATYSCARAVREYCSEKGIEPRIPVISDGGYATFSAIGKGLLFADAVMLGSMLAGTDEAPGAIIYDRQGRKLKSYKGMGSLEAVVRGSAARYDVQNFDDYVAEGVVGTVRSKGPVSQWVPQIKTGIRKCLQSLGYRSLEELHQAVFSGEILIERMSEAGKKEAGIHDLVEYRRDLPLD
ncbi:MAG: IMP dehydrogenase [Spirochaetaceae bacterium]|nr:MAG: IMP dehydrogenase [Spirochaetaceae bacterium]